MWKICATKTTFLSDPKEAFTRRFEGIFLGLITSAIDLGCLSTHKKAPRHSPLCLRPAIIHHFDLHKSRFLCRQRFLQNANLKLTFAKMSRHDEMVRHETRFAGKKQTNKYINHNVILTIDKLSKTVPCLGNWKTLNCKFRTRSCQPHMIYFA